MRSATIYSVDSVVVVVQLRVGAEVWRERQCRLRARARYVRARGTCARDAIARVCVTHKHTCSLPCAKGMMTRGEMYDRTVRGEPHRKGRRLFSVLAGRRRLRGGVARGMGAPDATRATSPRHECGVLATRSENRHHSSHSQPLCILTWNCRRFTVTSAEYAIALCRVADLYLVSLTHSVAFLSEARALVVCRARGAQWPSASRVAPLIVC